MSAHRTLKDLYKAFSPDIGPGLLNDPGDAGTITPTMWGQVCLVTTAGVTEARTLARPARAGIMFAVVHDTDGGDFTLTVTGGYNVAGETTISFDTAGDMAVFLSVKTGTTYQWSVIAQDSTGMGDLAVTAGTGMASADNFASSVEHIGSLYKTTIVIDIDGLESSTTLGDIIGGNDLANCHIGQITTARSGTIFAGQVECIEAPTGGDPDIDLYSATLATGTENAAIGDLVETALLTAGSTFTAGEVMPLTAYPPADGYLYLTVGAGGTAATYTAGILKIELWGK